MASLFFLIFAGFLHQVIHDKFIPAKADFLLLSYCVSYLHNFWYHFIQLLQPNTGNSEAGFTMEIQEIMWFSQCVRSSDLARIKPSVGASYDRKNRKAQFFDSWTGSSGIAMLRTVEIPKIPPGSCITGNFRATASPFHKCSQFLPKPRYTQHQLLATDLQWLVVKVRKTSTKNNKHTAQNQVFWRAAGRKFLNWLRNKKCRLFIVNIFPFTLQQMEPWDSQKDRT